MNTAIANAGDSPPRAHAGASIGWYVHLPFCTTKCGYCDFYSLPTLPDLIDRLVDALASEMAARDPQRPIESIFIGGGTPTVLPAAALEQVLTCVTGHTGHPAEFSCEANPSSTDELKLDLLRRYGVNRVSFGAQSFQPDELAVLQRIHDPCHIGESVRAARSAGFDNINLDLIYGIPGQTMQRWRDSLRRAVDLGPSHLSCYALMYEPGTALTRLRHQGRVVACDEDLEAAMFDATVEELADAGYEHYEISNFARPGRRCRANIIYWENREYLGIGPSAVSCLDGVRQKNAPDVRRYVETRGGTRESIVIERECLAAEHRALETAVQMLRLTDGIRFDRFREVTGFDARELLSPRVASFIELGLVERDEHGIRLTRRGLLVANRVMMELLPDSLQGGEGVS